jgi:hypothetical protein
MRPVIMGCGYSSLVRIVIVDAMSLLLWAWLDADGVRDGAY